MHSRPFAFPGACVSPSVCASGLSRRRDLERRDAGCVLCVAHSTGGSRRSRGVAWLVERAARVESVVPWLSPCGVGLTVSP